MKNIWLAHDERRQNRVGHLLSAMLAIGMDRLLSAAEKHIG